MEKTNWLMSFAKILRKNNFQDAGREKEIAQLLLAFQKFSGLNDFHCQLIANVSVHASKRNNTKVSELLEVFDERHGMQTFFDGLQELIAMGWLKFETDGPFSAQYALTFTHDAEVVLKTSDALHFPHRNMSETKKMHLAIYAKATFFRNREISTQAWKKQTVQWIKSIQSPFMKALKNIKIDALEKSIALYILALYAQEDENLEITKLLRPFANDPLRGLEIKSNFLKNTHPLYSNGFLEKVVSPRGDVYIKPGKKWFNQFLSGEDVDDDMPNLPNSLHRISHHDIYPRELMYNAEIQDSVNDLHDFVNQKNYNLFIKESKAMRENAGVILMLSGGPGTGKTELAKQLAKSSKRDLLYFDVSKQRNMFLGESEKALTEIFNRYADIAAKNKHVPILFFNESDSLFQSRINGGHGNTSNTENAILTILLNELEKFNGILICTTNRPESMDEAFHRRFLMHLRIDEPNDEIRYKLLMHNFPSITPQIAQALAKQYQFTAANLETYKQQNLLATIIQKTKGNIEDELGKFFESISQPSHRRNQIGFNNSILNNE